MYSCGCVSFKHNLILMKLALTSSNVKIAKVSIHNLHMLLENIQFIDTCCWIICDWIWENPPCVHKN